VAGSQGARAGERLEIEIARKGCGHGHDASRRW